MIGPCAKQRVTCTLYAADGQQFIGENLCQTPQRFCPRLPGEGYEKCKTVCNQLGHAEVLAVQAAGEHAKGAMAILTGHDHACADCQRTLFAAGVEWLRVE